MFLCVYQTAEKPTTVTETEAVASQSTAEELSADKPTNPSDQETPKVPTETITTANRDSEETRNRLAKAREELSRAREESARARDEVEKAKKDLAVAKQDTSSGNQAVAEQEKQPTEESSVPSEPSPKMEAVKEVSGETPEQEKSSDTSAAASINADVNETTNLQQESEKLEPPKEPVQDDSEKSNQNVQATATKAEDVEAKPHMPATSESQSVVDSEPIVEAAEVGATSNTTSEEAASEVKEDKVDDDSKASAKEKEESHEEEGELPEGQENEPVASKQEEGELAEDQDEDDHDEDDHDVEVVEGEREEGDGEESGEEGAPAKPLDDDEDRRNPQYIPKRGGFYEHDDRTREEGEEAPP